METRRETIVPGGAVGKDAEPAADKLVAGVTVRSCANPRRPQKPELIRTSVPS
jgi:hypothetical protein